MKRTSTTIGTMKRPRTRTIDDILGDIGRPFTPTPERRPEPRPRPNQLIMKDLNLGRHDEEIMKSIEYLHRNLGTINEILKNPAHNPPNVVINEIFNFNLNLFRAEHAVRTMYLPNIQNVLPLFERLEDCIQKYISFRDTEEFQRVNRDLHLLKRKLIELQRFNQAIRDNNPNILIADVERDLDGSHTVKGGKFHLRSQRRRSRRSRSGKKIKNKTKHR